MIISALKFNIDENLVLRSSWLKLGFLGYPHSHFILGVLLNLLWVPTSRKDSEPAVWVCKGCHSKVHSPGELGQQGNYFLTVLEAAGVKVKLWQVWFLMKLLSLACGWLSSLCLHNSSLLCVSVLQHFLLMRTSVTWDEGPPLWPHLPSRCLFKGVPTSKYSLILRH